MATDGGTAAKITAAIERRFGEPIDVDPATPGLDEIARMVEHCTHRKWTDRAVEPGLLRLLCAAALSAPSKSDLQQTDIVHVADRTKRQSIVDTIDDMDWIMDAPVFLVFCGNNRRLRLMGQWRGKPFPNDHLDQFFNAACDAAIIMSQFIRAAEAVGLGCCPISHVRNDAEGVSEVLGLPDWVFPFAGLCVGYPARGNRITPRLPLDVTVHTDRYDETRLSELIDAYDRRRNAMQPYGKQRDAKRYGTVDFYGWSEDKARQYGVGERENFGAFVRKKRFGLD
ncbi:MAG: NADPH-dependent oxidoreductase [Betaproteobacteria bacterium]|nr:MAG: NADPH-dependent oxidoreductase [Betaproteobacteria bacterium]